MLNKHNPIERMVDRWANGKKITSVQLAVNKQGCSVEVTQNFEDTLGQVLAFEPNELPRLINALAAADRALKDMRDAARHHYAERPFLSPHCAAGY